MRVGEIGLPALLLALSVALALVYSLLGRSAPLPQRLVSKGGSILLLALLSAMEGGSGVLIAALLFSALGDIALVFAGRRAFLAGLFAFFLAHLAFAAAIAGRWPPALSDAALWQVALLVVLGLAALGLLRAVWAGARGMRPPAAAYAGVIFLMVSLAVLAGMPVLIAGALLFFASDAVLSLETFRIASEAPIRRWTKPFVWWTYYMAQVFLASALLG